MRGLTQTVRTVWIMVYDQLTQTSCHTRKTVRVGITMQLWAAGMGMHVALIVCQFGSRLWTVVVVEVSSNAG